MPTFTHTQLSDITCRIFVAYGVKKEVARIVAESLVLSNLKGHDSHGIVRIIDYVDWLGKGWINPSGELNVMKDAGAVLMVEGNFGFGQVIGRQATELAIAKALKDGVCVLTIRQSAHLGRIGEWMEMAAEKGLVAFSFTNTHGAGVLVAPHGGRQPRLSANPLGGGVPLPAGSAMVMDMATSVIAEGKIKVAREKGESLPPGCIVNGTGEPSTDPHEYYAEPPGALLPFAGHKGYSLSMFAEIFAGVLSGGSCSKAGVARIANTFCGFFLNPAAFVEEEFYREEVNCLMAWVKSSQLMKGASHIMIPGEPEDREHQRRVRDGIPVPESIWLKISSLAEKKGVSME